MQDRSLASIFSKLNRGQELGWLADRPSVQASMADGLGLPVSRLRSALKSALGEAEQRRAHLRLSEVPYARPLDLTQEPLPPGIPELVLHPAEWRQAWWVAPAGTGRGLVGRWLEARQLAAFRSARTWVELVASLPQTGAVFCEVLEPPKLDEVLAFTPRLGLCVAAPAECPAPLGERWQLITSPPIAEHLPGVVQWLAARLPADGHFDEARALAWLRRARDAGLVESLDGALGLAGLIDTIGVGELERRPLHVLAQRYVRQRLEEAGRGGGADAHWLASSGFDVLLGIFERLLVDTEAPWDQPRSEEAWIALVPERHRDTVDPAWMKLALEQAGSRLSERDVERALRAMPPGAFRTVRALTQAELLHESATPELLELAPRWLGLALLARARELLAAGSPFSWGEALLAPHAAPQLFASLLTRLHEDPEAVIEQVLEEPAEASPEQVTALEAVFRGAGIVLLRGAEISADALHALWEEAQHLLVDWGEGHLAPRVDFPEPIARRAPALSRSTWLLSALAISEQLAGILAGPAALRPWSGACPPRELATVLDDIAAPLRCTSGEPPDWTHAAFALAGRAWKEAAPVDPSPSPPWLTLPGRLLDAITAGTLVWTESLPLAAEPLLFDALLALGAREAQPPGAIASALWSAWEAAGEPPLEDGPLSPRAPCAAALWVHVPPALLARWLAARPAAASSLPLHALPAACWDALCETQILGRTEAPEVWRAMPDEHLRRSLRAETGFTAPASAAEVGWQRLEAEMPALIEELFATQRSERAMTLIEAAPPAQTESAVELLRRRRRQASAQSLARMRRWLHARIAARAPGWREAYALLADLRPPRAAGARRLPLE